MQPLIIGGGPAGSAAAIVLGCAGQSVTLVERSSGPHDKVCGDFLSAGALGSLSALGIDVVGLGSVPINRIRLICGNEEAIAALPFAAAGVSRRALDEALLARAAAVGAYLLRGTSVRRLRRIGHTWAVDTDTCGAIRADTLFLATGKHDLRGLGRPQRSRVVGLKMYFALSLDQASALNETIELMLFSGGYAGLQLVESRHAVLCWLMPSHVLRRIGRWPAVLDFLTDRSAHLGRRLSGSRPLLSKPLAIAGIPYGFLS